MARCLPPFTLALHKCLPFSFFPHFHWDMCVCVCAPADQHCNLGDYISTNVIYHLFCFLLFYTNAMQVMEWIWNLSCSAEWRESACYAGRSATVEVLCVCWPGLTCDFVSVRVCVCGAPSIFATLRRVMVVDMPASSASIAVRGPCQNPRPQNAARNQSNERHALGDSSHYEEIALIGNGEIIIHFRFL